MFLSAVQRVITNVSHIVSYCPSCFCLPWEMLHYFPLLHIFGYQTYCFPLADMSLSAVRHVAFRCQTILFPLSNMLLSAVRHVAFRCRHMAFHRHTCCLPPPWLATLRSWRKILFYYICTQTTELAQLLTFSRVSSLCYLVSVFIFPPFL